MLQINKTTINEMDLEVMELSQKMMDNQILKPQH